MCCLFCRLAAAGLHCGSRLPCGNFPASIGGAAASATRSSWSIRAARTRCCTSLPPRRLSNSFVASSVNNLVCAIAVTWDEVARFGRCVEKLTLNPHARHHRRPAIEQALPEYRRHPAGSGVFAVCDSHLALPQPRKSIATAMATTQRNRLRLLVTEIRCVSMAGRRVGGVGERAGVDRQAGLGCLKDFALLETHVRREQVGKA